ncbi:hypothetical protein [Thiosocius teredinicola]|uniref:hypothetical protein n=1 Tax=Thiosocius teredinicola TaxID=1973002 RepID=UPI000F784625
MKAEEVELHDAILDGLSINYPERRVELSISYYPEAEHSKTRVPAKIVFKGVENVSEIANFIDLERNRSAGNITYWHPATKGGTTYIYLVSGVLAITAKSLKVKMNA